MVNPKRVIYMSSYDRGLEHLLAMWPDVNKAVPDAELHIFYGWQLFDRFHADNPASMKWKEKMLDLMKAEGVTDHGRIPQPELTEEIKKSGIWAYPTHFGEINCIGALKAQALGAVPVVVNYAALVTSVKFGKKIEGDIYDQEVKDEFKKQLIWVLQHPEWQQKVRSEMIPWAKERFTWKEVAKQWDAEFKGKNPKSFWGG